jgi:serine/threonine protein kinase
MLGAMVSHFASKRFKVVRCLGEGGMGVVYEAFDRDRGARVAVKTLRNASAEHLARLKREFRTMQEVQHPSLVTPRELVCEDDQWFLTMDLVDGVDFIEYVRAPAFAEAAPISHSSVRAVESAPTIPLVRQRGDDRPLFDEVLLRAVLRQLAEALVALHAEGMVHRDIKPSNVLVDRDGRLFVLDFGLVSDTRADASTIAVVGTPAYMAPEQAVSGDLGPAADWYAVGTMLYEALTGKLPFDGSAIQVMLRKQSETPAPASKKGVSVPADLDVLCAELLRVTPTDRPRGAAVLRALGSQVRPPEKDTSASRSITPVFVGRSRELDLLAKAVEGSRSEGAAVLVQGESGVGKSRLVRRFTEQLLLDDARAVVLSGRCFERESAPYKAFDGMVDAAVRLLHRMNDAEVRAVLPARPAPLVQIFPVLQRVPAIADAVRTPAPPLDPIELRRRAFGALREMLLRIGDRRTLVISIDDAQWSDHDSLALLAEVTRGPDAPRMLVLATIRHTRPGDGAAQADPKDPVPRLAKAIGTAVTRIELGPLSQQESRELAAQLAGHAGAGPAPATDIEAIASEAHGHPLFIDVLARQAVGQGGGAPGSMRLEDALGAQLAALDADSRAVAEVAAVAAGPLAHRVVERAAGLSPDRFTRAVRRLRVVRLVVTTGARGDDRIEPYHDRVRAAVFAGLTDERRKELHGAIARILEGEPTADAQALALHWREAGERQAAARFSVIAGDRAAQALGFERAASLYEQALSLHEPPSPERSELLQKLGDALANAGRGKRAADVLHRAAEGVAAAHALDLRRRAAEQLLRSGHFDEGVAALERSLASVGVSLPRTALGAVVQLLFFRVLLALRGLHFRERDATEVSHRALVRIDTCWSAAFGLALSDTVRGAALQARNLWAALRLGEPYRAARALALESAYASHPGRKSWRRTSSLIARARGAAERCGNMHALGFAAGSASAAYYLNGKFRKSLTLGKKAIVQLRAHARDVSWELDTAEVFAVSALAQLGALKELRERTARSLRQARDRGDVYASVNLRIGHANLYWLIVDDPARARRDADEAMAEWSKDGFHLEHYFELLARTNLDLYTDTPREAHARVVERWRALQRSLLPWKVQSLRILSWHMRARAALAVAAQGDERDALLRAVEADARRIARERMPWATPLATMLRAGVHRVRGDESGAVSLLRDAMSTFEGVDMALHANVARRALGALLGGAEGDTLVDSAEAWFHEQTVKRPDGFMAMLGPGLVAVPGRPAR